MVIRISLFAVKVRHNYCKFTIIRDNFIFVNIREFDRSRIQHSHEMFSHIEFTKENIMHREFKSPRKSRKSQNREIKTTRK